MLTLDGSVGEGGGQILRTSLSLSAATGQPFRIEKIRAGRKKPGLLRQHLTAVQAMAKACTAGVEGDHLGSTELTFIPGEVRAGEWDLSIGTAGSTMLVLQTLLPPLLYAGESTVRVIGGTHNPAAPPYEHFAASFLPQLRAMKCHVEAELVRPGFFPAGGGEVIVRVGTAGEARPLDLMERGRKVRHHAVASVAQLDRAIAERECDALRRHTGWPADVLTVERIRDTLGAGNIVTAYLEFEHVTEVITSLGRQGVPAERVATQAAREIKAYLGGVHPVGEFLADQLLVPMALCGGGRFAADSASSHLTTNVETCRRFLGEESIQIEKAGDGGWLVTVEARRPSGIRMTD